MWREVGGVVGRLIMPEMGVLGGIAGGMGGERVGHQFAKQVWEIYSPPRGGRDWDPIRQRMQERFDRCFAI